jgi:hypothetical protein
MSSISSGKTSSERVEVGRRQQERRRDALARQRAYHWATRLQVREASRARRRRRS